MFTWICPKCGGEVPPSHSECPRCIAAAAAAAQPVATEETPAALESVPPAPPAVSVRPGPAPFESVPPPRNRPARSGVPPLVVALVSGAGILGLLAVLYIYILPNLSSRSGPEVSTASTRLEPATTPPGVGGGAHPLAKYLEVAGIRVQGEQGERARIQMLVVNHSNAELPAMKMQTELIAADRSLFAFDVDLPSMGPYESREVNTVLKTDLKPYEMPDWQQLRPKFRLEEMP